VFPGQTHAPYHKTTDVDIATVASGLDNPWAVVLLPSGRFLITEKPGRLRILNRDGSAFHTITANMPPVYYRGQAGLLDVALDRNFASNHRIFFVYMHYPDLGIDKGHFFRDCGIILVASLVTFFGARAVRLRQGVDVDKLAAEIPPE